MTIEELDTPALVVDLDTMERNLARVADYCRDHSLRLRPHTKTHKSTTLARRQLEAGAVGLTVAKVGEAEVMLGSGTSDLLVAFPVVSAPKLRRLGEIAATLNVTVALDSVAAAQLLSEAARARGVEFGVLVEVDAGLGRVGVKPVDALALAQAVVRMPRLVLRGITFYPGHIREQDEEKIAQLSESIGRLHEKLEHAGMRPEIVSGGSTPLLFRSHDVQGLNEIRPGTYVFNDMNTVGSGGCGLEDCAASILVTVVSHHRGDRMIVDGGSKTFSSDRDAKGGATFGRVVDAPDAVFHKMNEEHGFIDLRGVREEFGVGSQVRIIPNHICVAVNLHEFVYGVRGNRVEEVWKVEARGKLQ